MDISKVAKLARLYLTEQEQEGFSQDFEKILTAIDKIEKVDTNNVEPLYSPSEDVENLREDVVVEWNHIDEVLESAPEVVGKLFKVPPVVS